MVYMSSNFLQLAVGSRDLSKDENRIKVQRADLTCDVTSIGSDDSSLDQSATSIQILLRSLDTFLIKLRL